MNLFHLSADILIKALEEGNVFMLNKKTVALAQSANTRSEIANRFMQKHGINPRGLTITHAFNPIHYNKVLPDATNGPAEIKTLKNGNLLTAQYPRGFQIIDPNGLHEIEYISGAEINYAKKLHGSDLWGMFGAHYFCLDNDENIICDQNQSGEEIGVFLVDKTFTMRAQIRMKVPIEGKEIHFRGVEYNHHTNKVLIFTSVESKQNEGDYDEIFIYSYDHDKFDDFLKNQKEREPISREKLRELFNNQKSPFPTAKNIEPDKVTRVKSNDNKKYYINVIATLEDGRTLFSSGKFVYQVNTDDTVTHLFTANEPTKTVGMMPDGNLIMFHGQKGMGIYNLEGKKLSHQKKIPGLDQVSYSRFSKNKLLSYQTFHHFKYQKDAIMSLLIDIDQSKRQNVMERISMILKNHETDDLSQEKIYQTIAPFLYRGIKSNELDSMLSILESITSELTDGENYKIFMNILRTFPYSLKEMATNLSQYQKKYKSQHPYSFMYGMVLVAKENLVAIENSKTIMDASNKVEILLNSPHCSKELKRAIVSNIHNSSRLFDLKKKYTTSWFIEQFPELENSLQVFFDQDSSNPDRLLPKKEHLNIKELAKQFFDPNGKKTVGDYSKETRYKYFSNSAKYFYNRFNAMHQFEVLKSIAALGITLTDPYFKLIKEEIRKTDYYSDEDRFNFIERIKTNNQEGEISTLELLILDKFDSERRDLYKKHLADLKTKLSINLSDEKTVKYVGDLETFDRVFKSDFKEELVNTFSLFLSSVTCISSFEFSKYQECLSLLNSIFVRLGKVDKHLVADYISTLNETIKGTTNINALKDQLTELRTDIAYLVIRFNRSSLSPQHLSYFNQHQETIKDVFLPWINKLTLKDRIAHDIDWKPVVKLCLLSYIDESFHALKFDPKYQPDWIKEYFKGDEDTISQFFLSRKLNRPITKGNFWNQNQNRPISLQVNDLRDVFTNLWQAIYKAAIDEFSYMFKRTIEEATASPQENQAHIITTTSLIKACHTMLKHIKNHAHQHYIDAFSIIETLDSKTAFNLNQSTEPLFRKTAITTRLDELIKDQATFSAAAAMAQLYDKKNGVQEKLANLKDRLDNLYISFQENQQDIDMPTFSNLSEFTGSLKLLEKESGLNTRAKDLIKNGLKLAADIKIYFGFLKNVSQRMRTKLDLIGEKSAYMGYLDQVETLVTTNSDQKDVNTMHHITNDPINILKVLQHQCLDYRKGNNADKLMGILLSPHFILSYNQGEDDSIIYSNQLLRLVILNNKHQTILLDKQYGAFGINKDAFMATISDVISIAEKANLSVTIPLQTIAKMGITSEKLTENLKKQFPGHVIEISKTKTAFQPFSPNAGYTDVESGDHESIVIRKQFQSFKEIIEHSDVLNPKETLKLLPRIAQMDSTCDKDTLKLRLQRFLYLYELDHPEVEIEITERVLYRLAHPNTSDAQAIQNAFIGFLNTEELASDYNDDDEWFTVNSESEEIQNYVIDQIGMNKDVLSIGIGEGYLESLLAKFNNRIVGVDINEQLSDEAKKNNISVIKGDAHNINKLLSGENVQTFDHILLPESIGDLDVRNVLPKLKKHLKPGASIDILTYLPYKKNLDDLGVERFSTKDFKTIATEAGFDIKETQRWDIVDEFDLEVKEVNKDVSNGVVYYRLQSSS